MSRKHRNHQIALPKPQGQISVRFAGFSGPLPPPDVLDRYNQIVPGAAERLIAMAERQAEHRHGLEKAVVNSGVDAQKLGVKCGMVVALAALCLSGFMFYLGHPNYGIAFAGGDIVSLVGVFVIGKQKHDKELDRNAQGFNKAASGRVPFE